MFVDASDRVSFGIKKVEGVQLTGANANFTQGMQFYNFIFLARSWASDRRYLVNRLAWLGKRAQEQDIPLTFILYPEGTIVSPNTRPISKRYADKMGIVSALDDRPMCSVPSLTHNYLSCLFSSRMWFTPSCRNPRGYITACELWLRGYQISKSLTLLWRTQVSVRSATDRSVWTLVL